MISLRLTLKQQFGIFGIPPTKKKTFSDPPRPQFLVHCLKMVLFGPTMQSLFSHLTPLHIHFKIVNVLPLLWIIRPLKWKLLSVPNLHL